MRYTTDEWGNTVWHIVTGKSSIELLKSIGFKDMPKDQYDKHMESYEKLEKDKRENFQKQIDEFLELFQNTYTQGWRDKQSPKL